MEGSKSDTVKQARREQSGRTEKRTGRGEGGARGRGEKKGGGGNGLRGNGEKGKGGNRNGKEI